MHDLREIDALIAEHILGYRRPRIEDFTPMTAEVFEKFIYRAKVWEKDGDVNKLSYYSSDIADAWEVVEKLKQDGWHIVIHAHEIPACVVYRASPERFYVDGPVPLSICRCALKIKGIEVTPS